MIRSYLAGVRRGLIVLVLVVGVIRPGLSQTPPGEAVLAPYLQALSAESVVVHWRTAQPAYGWVEYGETAELGNRADSVEFGLRRANVVDHYVKLEGLRPGASYYYRVGVKGIRRFGAYRVDYEPEQRSELLRFKALPGARQPVRLIVFNDLHSNLEAFHAVRNAAGDAAFDFSLFNGDCLADPADPLKTLSTLAALAKGVQAESRPAFFVRGNHETRGAFARDLPRAFSWPDGKPYFAFSSGPVRFLVLDCGEDKPDDNSEYSGLVNFEQFRKAETAWLKGELATPAFREAPWRVLIVHIPLYSTRARGGNSKPAQALWEPLLDKARIDLALHAHLHQAAYHPAHSVGNRYPIYIGGGNQATNATVMILDADERQLKLRVLNATGKEALKPFVKSR